MVTKKFLMIIDRQTFSNLSTLAKVQGTSRAAVVRELIADAAKELNGAKPALVASAQALAPKFPAVESDHAAIT